MLKLESGKSLVCVPTGTEYVQNNKERGTSDEWFEPEA